MKKNLLLLSILIACGTSLFAQVPSYVPTNGLVGWWPFNGNANDESGNGNNGTVNGATLTSDRFGNPNQAYSFDGFNDYISGTFTNFPLGASSRSISGWIEINNSNTNYQNFMISWGQGTASTSSANQAFGLLVDQNLISSMVWLSFGSSQTFNYSFASQTNYFLCVSIDEFLNCNFYINGQFIGTGLLSNMNTILNGNTFTMGKSTHTNTDGWAGFINGKLDDIGIWNRALTACEIQDLYNAQLGTSSTANEISCETYSWNGNTYTQSGQYTYQTTNANGCDSTATLNLTINQPSSSTQTQTSLDSYTWPVNGQTYTQSGTYTAVIPNAAGCDSTITLNLTLSFTGIDNQENSTFTISPNPASDYFILRASEELIGESYRIIDLNGKTLQEGTLTQKEQKIEIGNLSEGMYMFKINNETEQTFRIIKN